MGARHDMAAKLTFGFLLKSTEEMSEEDMPHDGSEALFGSDEAGTASQLYRRHPLLAETRRNIRQMTPVPAILPCNHIRDLLLWLLWSAFCEHICLFMLILHDA